MAQIIGSMLFYVVVFIRCFNYDIPHSSVDIKLVYEIFGKLYIKFDNSENGNLGMSIVYTETLIISRKSVQQKLRNRIGKDSFDKNKFKVLQSKEIQNGGQTAISPKIS